MVNRPFTSTAGNPTWSNPRYRRGIGTTTVGALLCLRAPVKAELLVTVSKSQQQLAVVVDGAEIYRWPVSTSVPMADAENASAVAANQGAGEGENYFAAKSYTVKARSDSGTAYDDETAELGNSGTIHAVVNRMSVGSNEAKILRERAAWLRSLDRKYDIAR